MDFLKAIFGDKSLTFDELAQVINAHNGDEANKDNQIKLGNLGNGEYVGKAKYDALDTSLKGKITELDTANGLIAELKKGTKGDEELQGRITNYETQVANLQKELQETKVRSALKVALLSEKASDIDYLTFKINEKLKDEGKTLELDSNEQIKGWDDLISGIKTQFPTQFEAKREVKIEPNRLPNPNNSSGFTKAELLKKPYAERQKIYEDNPEAYKTIMNS